MTKEERQKWLQAKQQVLPFDFWDEEKQQAAAKDRLAVENLPHFPQPKTDNEKLLELQWEYKHGDQQALVKMYKISKTICLKFINSISNQNKHVRALSLEAKKIKAEDAATYIIEQYIRRPDFAINKNYPGYLFLRVAHELFYMRKVDKIVNFVDLKRFFKEGVDDDQTSEEEGLCSQQEIIPYEYKMEPDTEEDQERRELKQFNTWRKKQIGGTK